MSDALSSTTVEAVVERLGARGDGVATLPDGTRVFAPFTLPGERVRFSREADAEPRPLERLTDSPDRQAPACAHFETCGGCAVQHVDARVYRTWKQSLIREALAHAGLEAEIAPVRDASRSGRRRATFHAVRAKAVGQVFGFTRRASHQVFALDDCPVLTPAIGDALPLLRRAADALLPKAGRADVHVTAAENGLDVDLRGGSARSTVDLTTACAELAEAGDWARVSLSGEPLIQRREPEVRLGEVAVTLPPGAFLQATQDGETALAELVTGMAGGAEKTVDLYAGLGSFALRLARRAEVRAFEGDTDAVAACKAAIARAPADGVSLKPLLVQRRDLARNPVSARELGRPDLVVLDPPRAGATKQAHEIARSGAQRTAYVSCNPATFARDARILVEGGFRLEKVHPIDQFLWSPHVEVVGDFRR